MFPACLRMDATSPNLGIKCNVQFKNFEDEVIFRSHLKMIQTAKPSRILAHFKSSSDFEP
jgi:hypothetical protein